MSTEHFPEIIREAATSPLGILALIILLLGSLAVAFFGKASEKVRLTIWLTAFGGALLFGFAILRQSIPELGDGQLQSVPDVTYQDPGELEVVNESEEAERTTIQIGYQGDPYGGCDLRVAIAIGDKMFQPRGSLVALDDVLSGSQSYRIRGNINCIGIGHCQVEGQGTIEVVHGGLYYFLWQQTGVGHCSAVLESPF